MVITKFDFFSLQPYSQQLRHFSPAQFQNQSASPAPPQQQNNSQLYSPNRGFYQRAESPVKQALMSPNDQFSSPLSPSKR